MQPSDLTDALTDVVTRLEAVGVDYMLTGAAAGGLYGVMRTPADIDIVVDLADRQVGTLVEALTTDYYIEADAVFDAVKGGGVFNGIPTFRGLKADFIVLRDEPFELAAFARRQQIERHGGAVWTITPSDLVLSMLRWAQESFAGQQLADIRTIMASGQVAEDDDFRGWIDRLGLHAVLDASRTTRYDA